MRLLLARLTATFVRTEIISALLFRCSRMYFRTRFDPISGQCVGNRRNANSVMEIEGTELIDINDAKYDR